MVDLSSSSQRLAPAWPSHSPNGTGFSESDEGPGFGEYLGALRRRFWVVLLLGVVGAGLAGYSIWASETLYSSKTVVQMVDERASPTGGLAGLAATLGGGGGSLASQVQVIRSRLILGQVVDSLGLRLHREVATTFRDKSRPTGLVDQVSIAPDAVAGELHLAFEASGVEVAAEDARVRAAYGEPVEVNGVRFVVPQRPERERVTLYLVPRDVAIDALLDEVKVFTRDNTNIIDVVVTGYDRAITQRVADATAAIYRRFSTEKAREEAERRRRFIMDQMQMTEELLRETQDQLTEFRKREGLYSSKAQAMMEQGGKSELEMRRAELDADRRVYQALLAGMESGGRGRTTDVLRTIASSPSVIANPVIQTLYAQLSQYESRRDSLIAGPWRSSSTNPDVQRLDSLVSTTQSRLLAATRNHIESLSARVAALDAIDARIQGTLQHLSEAEPEEARLMLRLESIGEAAMELRARYYTAGMAEAATVDRVTVLDPALPGVLAGTGPGRTLALGLIFGLMVGAAGAVLLDSASHQIRRREELERVLRVPGLGVIPQLPDPSARWRGISAPARLRGAAPDPRHSLVTLTRANSLDAEAYRTLRTNLLLSPGLSSLRSIVVTSPAGGEGKTTTAANLAISFAQHGRRVLLVDCDLRRPRLHTLLRVAAEPGLSEVLAGDVGIEQAIRTSAIDNLSVLPAGRLPQMSATDLMAGGAVRALLDALSADFDLVVLDGPPVLVAASTAILGEQADGVLLVVRSGHTTRDAAQMAVRQLATVGVRVVGAVLNGAADPVPRDKSYSVDEVALTQ